MATPASIFDIINEEEEKKKHLSPDEHPAEVPEVFDSSDPTVLFAASEIGIESFQSKRLALEAELLNNAISAFKGVISNISNKMSSLTSMFRGTGLTSKICQDIIKVEKENSLISKLESAKYSEYSGIVVSQPEGFNGDFLTYVRTLINVADPLYKGTDEFFNAYIGILKTFLSNKDAKTSLKEHNKLYKDVEKQRTELTKKVENFFKAGNYQSKVQIKKVLYRLSDVKPLMDDIKTLDAVNNKTTSSELKKKVDQCSELLTEIHNEVQKGSITDISGSAALNISKGAYEFAKYMEYVSVFRWRVDQISQSVLVLLATLSK